MMFIPKIEYDLLVTREGIHLGAVAPASMATTASRTAAVPARRPAGRIICEVINPVQESWWPTQNVDDHTEG